MKIKLECQTTEIEHYKKETEVQRREAETQYSRNVFLRDKVEKITKERDMIRDRMIDETKIRNGIRMTK